MRKLEKWLMRIADVIIIASVACGYWLGKQGMPVKYLAILCLLFAIINIIPAIYTRKIKNKRLRICKFYLFVIDLHRNILCKSCSCTAEKQDPR